MVTPRYGGFYKNKKERRKSDYSVHLQSSMAIAKETHFTNNRGVLDVCLSSWKQEVELGKKVLLTRLVYCAININLQERMS